MTERNGTQAIVAAVLSFTPGDGVGTLMIVSGFVLAVVSRIGAWWQNG